MYDGTVTSCQLPHPDWQLYAGKFSVDSEKARASHSVFRLLNVPLLYLPYVTHPVDTGSRQSGILIPVIGNSSTKGLVLGRAVLLGDQSQHGSDGGGAVLLAARMGAGGHVPVSRAGQQLCEGALQRAAGSRLLSTGRAVCEPGRRGCDLRREVRFFAPRRGWWRMWSI